MKKQIIFTGCEVEFCATHIVKVDQIAPGMTRLYWGSLCDGNWRVISTQIVPDSTLAALRNPALFVNPAQIDQSDEAGLQRHH